MFLVKVEINSDSDAFETVEFKGIDKDSWI